MTAQNKIIIAIILIGFFLSAWAFHWEPGFRHHVKTYKISIENWKHDGYKVVVLADLHIGSPYNDPEKLDHIVELVNQVRPDLILIVGDFVIQGVIGGSFVSPAEIAKGLEALKAKDGTYAVLGNHDHWHDSEEISHELEAAGISVLTNQSKFINGYWLVGVDDSFAGNPDLEKALLGVDLSLPTLLFTHNPDLFVEVPDSVSLNIAGHTHGGQVYFPLIGRPIVPSKYGERFAIGHIIEDKKQMFVSPGTGTSIIPVRFLVPPEISLVELYSK